MKELLNYISDPKNAQYNFDLGRWYEMQGHTAAAAGFYVRTTEVSQNALLTYEALLRIAICLLRQGARLHVSKGVLLRAVSLEPTRPEAYFLLSQTYEHNKEWQEAYTWASLRENVYYCGEITPLQTDVGYPGEYGFTFEKAVAGWWCGLWDESMHLFRQLKRRNDLQPQHRQAVEGNLARLEPSTLWKMPLAYTDASHERLKVKFPGSHLVKQNYSQCYQDLFVLTMLQGKTHGVFLEVGCGDPYFGNNTALLEQQFGWNGWSIDIDVKTTATFDKERGSKVITADATQVDFAGLLNGVKDVDYLQIDCDPALNSLNVLFRMPFHEHRFAVITFEHDGYHNPDVIQRSREYLKSFGYKMVAGNIAPDDYLNFEDWWVHPDLVKPEIIQLMERETDNTRRADKYMLNLG